MKKTKTKLNLKEKIVLASFLSVIPKIIDIWQRESPNVGLDVFLLSIYEKNKKGVKTNG